MLYSNIVGNGTDLVLLHGWGFNADLFNDIIKKYKNKYRITAIDLPNHGRSPIIKGGLDEWSREIIKILPQNPIILGWSLGGLLAINIANKIKISKLILVSSTPNFIKTNNWQYGIDANNFKQFYNSLQLNPTKTLKRFITLQSKNKTKIKAINEIIEKYTINPKALSQGLDILLTTNLTSVLKNLTISVEAVLGEHDTFVPYKINKWYKSQNIKIQSLKTGHLPFLDDNFLL